VHIGKTELEAKGFRDLLLSREVQADEHDTQAFARALLLGKRGAEVPLGDEACLNQAFADLIAHAALTRYQSRESNCTMPIAARSDPVGRPAAAAAFGEPPIFSVPTGLRRSGEPPLSGGAASVSREGRLHVACVRATLG